MRKEIKTDQNLCHQACKILISELKKKVVGEKNEADWKIWFADIKNSSQIIESYIQFYSRKFDHETKELNSLWQRCILVKLFIQHFCSLDALLFKRCIILWNFFTNDDSIDFKTLNTFERLEKFLEMLYKPYQGTLSKENKVCKGCDSLEFDFLYKSCAKNCFICENCIKEMRTTKMCPSCSQNIEDNNSQFIQVNIILLFISKKKLSFNFFNLIF